MPKLRTLEGGEWDAVSKKNVDAQPQGYKLGYSHDTARSLGAACSPAARLVLDDANQVGRARCEAIEDSSVLMFPNEPRSEGDNPSEALAKGGWRSFHSRGEPGKETYRTI